MTREPARTAAHYELLLISLLPAGPFWDGFRDPDGDGRKLIAAKAETLAAIDRRSVDLMVDVNPAFAVETLSSREREASLPDACLPAAATLQERQAALLARWGGRGGQSRQFFIDLAKTLGFDVTITEFRPFRTGVSACGDSLCSEVWKFAWRVNAPATTVVAFRTGASATGEPLRKWGNGLLECAIDAKRPAHTVVQFRYGG